MSSSGLIYAVIVGAWAAYLVPMWLRRQDELNEARPTERFSTAIRLLSGRAGMERRYAKDLRARSTEEGEHAAEPDGLTESVDARAFAMPRTRREARGKVADVRADARGVRGEGRGVRADARSVRGEGRPEAEGGPSASAAVSGKRAADSASRPRSAGAPKPGAKSASQAGRSAGGRPVPQQGAKPGGKPSAKPSSSPAPSSPSSSARSRRVSAAEAAARARRSKVLARRRRTTTVLFLAFTLGAIVAAVGGLAFLWAPGAPAIMLSVYIAYLRSQERGRFTYTMDRRRAEAAAQRLRERQPRRRPPAEPPAEPSAADDPEDGPEPTSDPGLSALTADRRALVEQTDHAEWVDQQRERRRGPAGGDSWDPVPVPLPTYVTAPVAPRATAGVDLGAPDAWSSARSSAAERPAAGATPTPEDEPSQPDADSDGAADARRAAAARRARERGRTPLFDQYEDGDRPRAANE